MRQTRRILFAWSRRRRVIFGSLRPAEPLPRRRLGETPTEGSGDRRARSISIAATTSGCSKRCGANSLQIGSKTWRRSSSSARRVRFSRVSARGCFAVSPPASTSTGPGTCGSPTRTERTGRPPGREIQRGGKGPLTLGKKARGPPDARTLQPAVGRAHRSERRLFVADGHGGDSNRRASEVLERRKVYKDLGRKGADRGEFEHSSRPRHGFQGAAVVGDRGKTAESDLRPRREFPRRVEAIRPAKRALHRSERHLWPTWPITVQREAHRFQSWHPDRQPPRTVRSVLSSGPGRRPETQSVGEGRGGRCDR